MFLVSGRVDGVQSRLQVVPGEKSFTCPPLLLTQLLEIPEHTLLLLQESLTYAISDVLKQFIEP